MATGTRTRLPPEHRRAQLLELGVEILSTHRLDEVAIDEIAEAAGISRGLLFHYFPSKRAFHLAVVETAAEQLLERTEPDPELPVIEQLRSGVGTFVDYVRENRDIYVSLVRGASGGDREVRAIFDRVRSAFCDRILQALSTPSPVPAPVRAAVRGWLAFADEVIVGWLSQPTPDMDRDELVEFLDDALIALVKVAVAPPEPAPGCDPP